MIFAPEYSGVCSCRIVRPPALNTRYWPSGDQLIPPSPVSSVTRVSRPSASERITSWEVRLKPDATDVPGDERMNATRDPSGDGTTFDSASGVVHTGDAGPPSIGTRQRSPPRVVMSALPSAPQNAPASVAPAPVNSRGLPDAPGSATYTFDTPARSQTNTTYRPSGDHIGIDG